MPGNLRDKLILTLLAAALAALGGCQAAMERTGESHFRPWALGPEPGVKSIDAGVADARGMGAYDAAVAMVDAGQYAKAEGAFAKLVGQFRQAWDVDRASKSWFWLGYCLEKRGAVEAAAGEYRKLMAEFPASQAARTAQGRLERMGAALAPGKGSLGPPQEPAKKTTNVTNERE